MIELAQEINWVSYLLNKTILAAILCLYPLLFLEDENLLNSEPSSFENIAIDLSI